MYFVFVRPIIEYADVVWAGAYFTDLVKLDKLQVDAMRLVTGCTKRSNIANLYKDCNWESLNIRRDKHILKMIYKIMNNQAPNYLKNIIPNRKFEVVPYPLRNSEDFIVPGSRLESFKRSFIPYGATL